MSYPKVAIYYDWLNQWGGAERVLLDILNIYPKADLYTLVYNPNTTRWLPSKHKIFTSFINNLPFSSSNPIIYTPLYDIALEQLDLSRYDIVISTTSTVGHCLLTKPQTLFICYYHNINRYLYYTPIKYRFLSPMLGVYKKIDKLYASRPDAIFCNSNTVRERIRQNLNTEPVVINPGIDTNFFVPSTNSKNDYFLVISRLVPHKNIGIVISAFLRLTDKLIIVGEGREKDHLVKLADNNPNIEFREKVNDLELLSLYQNCRGLICPQEEDFGLTPIEAQACGKPVIAFNKGGITESVVNKITGIFYYQNTISDIVRTIKIFKQSRYSSMKCRENSLKFSAKYFMLNFKQSIDNLWKQHQIITR